MHRAFHIEREYVAPQPLPVRGLQGGRRAHPQVRRPRGGGRHADHPRPLKLVGIDVILLHRLLKNDVPLREYVLMTEDLYGTGSAALTPSVGRVDRRWTASAR